MARLLPPDEWARIRATGMNLPPIQAAAHMGDVIVIERGDQIVGCWALMTVFHAEGLWIDPAEGLAAKRRLWSAMKEIAHSRGATAAWINPVEDEVAALAHAHGATPIPGEHFVLPLED